MLGSHLKGCYNVSYIKLMRFSVNVVVVTIGLKFDANVPISYEFKLDEVRNNLSIGKKTHSHPPLNSMEI